MSSDEPSVFPVTKANSNAEDGSSEDGRDEPFFSDLFSGRDSLEPKGKMVGEREPAAPSEASGPSPDKTGPDDGPSGATSAGGSGSGDPSSALRDLFRDDLLAPPASGAVSLPKLTDAEVTENALKDSHSAINAVENAVALQARKAEVESLNRKLEELSDLARRVADIRKKAAVSHRKATMAYQQACRVHSQMQDLVETASFRVPGPPAFPSTLAPSSSSFPDFESTSAFRLEDPVQGASLSQSVDPGEDAASDGSRGDGSAPKGTQISESSEGKARDPSKADRLQENLAGDNQPDSGSSDQDKTAHKDNSGSPVVTSETPSAGGPSFPVDQPALPDHDADLPRGQRLEEDRTPPADEMPPGETSVPGKPSSSLFYGLLYTMGGIVFIAGDVVMSRELVASAFRLSGTVAPWVFAASLASLALLLKPAYTRLVESQYWSGRTVPFKTVILFVSVLAITCLGVLGVYRYQAHSSRTELRHLRQQMQEGSADLQAIQSRIAALQREVAESPYGLASFALTAVLFAISGAVALGIGVRHLRGVWHWRVMRWRRSRRLRSRQKDLRSEFDRHREDLQRHHAELTQYQSELASLPSLPQIRAKASALKSDREEARRSLELSEKAFLQEIYATTHTA